MVFSSFLKFEKKSPPTIRASTVYLSFEKIEKK